MRHVVFAALVVFALIAALFSARPAPVAAQEGVPGAPVELCSADELARGERAMILPVAQDAGVVTPLGSEGEVLYLSVVTLPPESCLGYRYREGGVVLFVHEGTIDYTAHATDLEPNPEVLIGSGDSIEATARPVELDTAITLGADEWITQDRSMWYTFRNSGEENALVTIASYVVPPWIGDPCQSSCRQP